MKDGLYQITKPCLCAGFVIKNGKVDTKKERNMIEKTIKQNNKGAGASVKNFFTSDWHL